MKANFVCFKLSKTVAILIFIILLQLIFIGIGIKEILETNSFEDIQDDVKKLNKINKVKEDKIVQDSIENNIDNERIKEEIKENNQNKIVLEEYKNMPSELKGYKVIRKNYNPKGELKFIYIIGNK